MKNFLRFCSIISLVIFSIRLAMLGILSQGIIFFIIISGLLILFGNRTIYVITAAVATLVLFVKTYGGNSTGETSLLTSILTLALVVFGFYIMIRGIFQPTKRRR